MAQIAVCANQLPVAPKMSTVLAVVKILTHTMGLLFKWRCYGRNFGFLRKKMFQILTEQYFPSIRDLGHVIYVIYIIIRKNVCYLDLFLCSSFDP